ncbi:MAG: damage-inducible protein DinB [Fluviicola sp. XM-24bin1]|nr:MAG: damage-inducible protein DinB [Fluviicola sp. XM-24bin1]
MIPSNEYHPYFESYIGPLSSREESIAELMEISAQSFVEMLLALPEEKENYRYAERKWTIKELLQHINDTERIFQNRALRFSRKDETPLPGFDHDNYNVVAQGNDRALQSLIDEFVAVRQASITLFGSFSDEMMKEKGEANGHLISVRAIGYLVSGHQMHHQRVFEERYL